MSIRFRIDPISWIFGLTIFLIVYIGKTMFDPFMNIILTEGLTDPLAGPIMQGMYNAWNHSLLLAGILAVAYIILSSIRREDDRYYYEY